MKTKQMFRQGDVLIERVDALPAGATDVTDGNRIVLAHGEVTGHAHAIYEPQTKALPRGKARMWSAGAERYIQVIEATAVKHEEHAPVALDHGVYRVVHQREYTPEEIIRVAD